MQVGIKVIRTMLGDITLANHCYRYRLQRPRFPFPARPAAESLPLCLFLLYNEYRSTFIPPNIFGYHNFNYRAI